MELECRDEELLWTVEAPFHSDPPPPGPPGPTDGLWNHEVVELFLVGGDPAPTYVEIEISPHGHHLRLRLEGRRNIVESGLPLTFEASIRKDRWQGLVRLPRRHLPPTPHRLNAFAIHGQGASRRYLAWTPVPGPEPDFHRLDLFPHVELV